MRWRRRGHHVEDRPRFIFQQFHLLEAIDAVDNVAHGHRMHHRPPQMSGGERQRVAVARAIVGDPAIVLADEPTGNLDSRTSADIIDLLLRLHEEGSTIVVITHDPSVAADMPRQLTIQDGEIVHDSGRMRPASWTPTVELEVRR